jgi:hypothetical protein
MNDRERAVLQKRLDDPGKSGLRGCLGCSAVLGISAAAAWFGISDRGEWLAGILGGMLVLFALIALYQGVAYHITWLKYRRTFEPQAREALDGGGVEVDHYEAEGLVELLEMEDEGSNLFFDIGDGKILFLQGQEYYEAADDAAPWPNTCFEIAHTVKHKLYLGVLCYGEELKPQREIDPDDFNYDHVPQEQIFEGRLESLEEDLARIAEAKQA